MASSINATSTGSGGIIQTADATGVLNIQTNETTAITVGSTQNVGIGASSLYAKLTSKGTGGAATSTYKGIINAYNADVDVGLSIGGYNATPYAMYIQALDPRTGFATTYPISLNPDGGNVGIGTSSPAYKLDVQTAAGRFQVRDLGGSSLKLINSTTGGNIGIDSAGGITLIYANGTETARFDASGNLGLGVTPSAWTVFKVMQIGSGLAAASSGTTNARIFGNAYYDGSYRYLGTGRATQYEQDGYHAWSTSASGTAGNPITFTQAMTLDTSGNLLVGTTSATYSASGRGLVEINGSSTSLLALKTGGSAAGYVYHDGTEMSVVNTKAGSLQLTTNGAERARIDSSGNLLVGTTTNSGRFTYFKGATSTGTYFSTFENTTGTSANAYGIQIYYSGASPNGSSNQFLDCTDSAGGGTLRARIKSNGGIDNFSANNTNLSDRQEKTNFAPASDYLSKICSIPVQTFNYIDQNLEEDPGLTLGVVAQDVQAVAPELVKESNWGTEDEPKMRLSIYQTDLQYALMKALQELKAEFDAYKLTHP